jgi:hypothetical protein
VDNVNDGISPDEITALVESRYDSDGEGLVRQLFCFALDVMDVYVRELEKAGAESPLPYMGQSPVEAATQGVYENLQLRRDPTWGHS